MLGDFRVPKNFIDMFVKQGNTSSVNTRSENGCKDKKRTVYKEEFGGVSKEIKSLPLASMMGRGPHGHL